ncbi:MAG TPA: FkbM family methyltransferase [Terriglobales bacterium]|nr:FkbM family methyltransferase [Terriglobales bacterium]
MNFGSILDGLGIHHRLRASRAYDLCWLLRSPRQWESRRNEKRFYRRLLGAVSREDLIFDVGANVGEKCAIFLRLGARVVAVEPDQASCAILKEKFFKLRLRKPRLTIVCEAVGRTRGEAEMFLDRPGSAVNTLSEKWAGTLLRDSSRAGGGPFAFERTVRVPVTTLAELVDRFGLPRYIKIDVEGHEFAVLSGLGRPVPLLSFEANLPEFLGEAQDCIKLLTAEDGRAGFNYTADCGAGFALARWVGAGEMASRLETCGERSVEIFCRPSLAR